MKKYLYSFIGIIVILALIAIIFKNPLSQTIGKFSSKLFPQPAQVQLTKIIVTYHYASAAKPEMAVAIKNKLFEKYGLSIEINEVTSGQAMAQALISGKTDVVLAGQATFLKAAAAGAKIKSVGLINSSTRWYFVSRKEPQNIKTYCAIGITTEDYLRGASALKNLGIDINSLNITNLPSDNLCINALISGKVDSMTVAEPIWENLKMQNKDLSVFKIITKAYGGNYIVLPVAILVMNNTLSNKNQAIENFSKALIEANYWLKVHSEAEIEKEISGVAKIDPSMGKIYSKIIKGQLEGIKFTQKLSEVEAIRKTYENITPQLKDYNVKNFLSTQISDDLKKQGFLQKYGF